MRGEPCCGWRGVGSAFPTGTMPCACCPCRRTADASEIEPSEANPAARSEGREAACRKYTVRGLAQACESAWRCTELYRVPRRPYLIAARPPDLAFNFLRTDYGPAESALRRPATSIIKLLQLSALRLAGSLGISWHLTRKST